MRKRKTAKTQKRKNAQAQNAKMHNAPQRKRSARFKLGLYLMIKVRFTGTAIQWDIYSLGNLANGKEHWLQIYSPLSHSRLKITILAPS
jgi:hypothetical protein